MKVLCKSLVPFIAVVWIGCTGCHQNHGSRLLVDSLNKRAYDWHYRDVDSVRQWATTALEEAKRIGYHEGEGEALNNLAFERFQQMDFDSVQMIANRMPEVTSSQVELLVADVMLMKVAQRTSDNLAFFYHRNHALRRIGKLADREHRMDAHEHRRYAYGCSEAHIVASTYFYYLDQQERAIAEIHAAEPYCQMPEDTAQWLNYHYMRGSGGLSEQTDPKDVTLEEFEHLNKCFWRARFEGYRFFEANAEQSLATLFADSDRMEVLLDQKLEQVQLLTTIFGQEGTAMNMANAAYDNFIKYDDLYQEACVLRTLGELSFEAGEYEDAIQYYAKALDCVNLHHLCYYAPDEVLDSDSDNDILLLYEPDQGTESVERKWMESPDVKTVPEWIAGIRQQLSVAYSALDFKAGSDYNRNIYLDLLDVTREDAELESRVAELKAESVHLRWLIGLVIVFAIFTCIFTWLLLRTHRRRTEKQKRLLQQKFKEVEEMASQKQQELAEEQEQLLEQKTATEQRLLRDKRLNIEKRTKLQLVYGIVPYLDRIINEVERMKRRGESSESSLSYIGELTDRIIEYNDLLTDWIQMEQGQLSLQLSSFSLEPLFESIRKNHYAYDQKGLTLEVTSTDLSVKADRALTLFMINTLADNARKFTPTGGRVTISAQDGENEDGRFVEISVQDTGIGLSAEDIELILTHKVYDAGKIGSTSVGVLECSRERTGVRQGEYCDHPQGKNEQTPIQQPQSNKGFGFGLMNCKGIIEKYRKTNPLFRVCQLGIDSRVGEGSRFWFRLPRVMTLLVFFALFATSKIHAEEETLPARAYQLADSAYFSNVEGKYADALLYAHHALSLIGYGRDSLDYSLVLGLRNESAIAALALHDWSSYRYNNQIYTRLYKRINRDTTLEAYCLQTERSQQTQRLALMLIVVMILVGLAALYFFYIRPRIRFRQAYAQLSAQRLQLLKQTNEAERERQQTDYELAEDEHRRRLYEENRLHVQNQIIDNCLSAIKHETMYYPGRIQQLLKRGGSLSTLSETVSYYKEVYMLLSAQASQQSEAVNFRRRRLIATNLEEALSQSVERIVRRLGVNAKLELDNQIGETTFQGDQDLLLMLLESLLEAELTMSVQNETVENETLALSLTIAIDGHFVRFTLKNPYTTLSEEQIRELFTPHQNGIAFLICKQIIREHDTFMGHPGCRINAESVGEGHQVWFTLPLDNHLSRQN